MWDGGGRPWGSILKLLQDFVELPCHIQLCAQDLYQSLQYDATH